VTKPPKRPRLRLVADKKPGRQPESDSDDLADLWLDIGADPLLDGEPATQEPKSTRKPQQLRRSTRLFGNAPEDWLLARDCPLPTFWRFYFLLQIRSVQGTKPVHASTKLAAQVGISQRSGKLRHLQTAERLGLVVVTRIDRRKGPLVKLCPIHGWPPK
jgi:hypothetical protein